MTPPAAPSSPSGSHADRLAASLAERRALIGVIGLGYVGLPLSLTAAQAGYRVLGFDINAPRVEGLNRDETFTSPKPEPRAPLICGLPLRQFGRIPAEPAVMAGRLP